MGKQEVNIFLIKDIEGLNCDYKKYKVKGLAYNSEDFHRNKQHLINELKKETHSPLVSFMEKNDFYIVQLEGYEILPETWDLIRNTVTIEQVGMHHLDFSTLNPNTYPIAKKFLSWELQSKFYNNPNLWQPQSGYPFFHKSPDKSFRKHVNEIDLFKGFSFRVVKYKNQLGLCVDVSRKYISQSYLPYYITREDFKKKYMGRKCLYEFGTNWYEIRLNGWNQLKANQISIQDTGETLYRYVISKDKKYNTQITESLPEDCSVLYYFKNNFQYNVPSGLCRLTFKTNHPDIKKLHHFTLLEPEERRSEILRVVDKYFNNLTFGTSSFEIFKEFLSFKKNCFDIPDLIFGKNTILSLKNNQKNTYNARWDNYGFSKKKLLTRKNVGLYTLKKFDYQYLILPRSISETYGSSFIKNIKDRVNRLYFNGQKLKYDPQIVYYNEPQQKSIFKFAKEIKKSIEDDCNYPGYGLVMIPKIRYSSENKEDELANYIMSEARNKEISVSIIHKTLSDESYIRVFENGRQLWKISDNETISKRYKGYLNNVVLNKILIHNHYWPFILGNDLNADLIIGIDIKNNVAGFTFINKKTDLILFKDSVSNNKEQLSMKQVYSIIYKAIKIDPSFEGIRNIEIHRHGRIFPSEKEGIIKALNALEKEGIISSNYVYTIVEVRSSSRIPYRQFEINNLAKNPRVGTYNLFSENEGFICTTGDPYRINGTIVPLHILKEGYLSIESVLKDVFYLSNLTYTKIDYCSKLPFSIKLNDIRLKKIAGEFDEDEFKFGGED